MKAGKINLCCSANMLRNKFCAYTYTCKTFSIDYDAEHYHYWFDI